MNASTAPLPRPGSATAVSTRAAALALASVLLVTFLAYAGTMRFGFVYDDAGQIVDNPVVQSWRMVPRMFAEHVWSSQVNVPANYYRPLFLLWCLLNFKAFGLNPAWWHLTTVLLHLLATALVFRLTQRLASSVAGRWSSAGDSIFVPTVTALIFGLHPIHIESVAWISGVTDPLFASFALASFLCYLNAREAWSAVGSAGIPAAATERRRGRSVAWLAASLAFYACACLSKEPGIVLPAIIAAYELIFAVGAHANRPAATDRLRRVAITLAPYAAIAAGYLAMRHHVLRGFGHATVTVTPVTVPLTWPELLWFYARKLVWPVGLSPFYDTPYVTHADAKLFWLPLLAVAAVACAVWWYVRSLPADDSRRFALFAIAWIVIPLLPVLDILSLEPREIAHDRYLYLPVFGLALLVAMGLRRLRAGSAELFGRPAAQVVVVIALVAAMGVATVQQSLYWANDLLLFYRAVRVAPSSISAHNNLADALLIRGYYREGIAMHEQILRRDPNYWLSHYNLGNAYFKLGQLDKAQQEMYRAVQLNSSNPQLLLFLSVIQMQRGDLAAAEQNTREALRIWPHLVGANYVLGLVREKEQRWSDAADAFRRELALNPDQPKVKAELANAEKQAAK